MQLKRVVITGLGAISPFGHGMGSLYQALIRGQSGISIFPEADLYGGLRCRVAGLVKGVDSKKIPRKYRRSMSAMSIYATLACQEALSNADLDEKDCAGGELGAVIGTTVGSTQASEDFFTDFLSDRCMERMKSTVFFKIMNHSCAANVAQALGIAGRVISPAAACSTGCQTVGLGYEAIALGRQKMMLCGGADEFHPLTAATFDIMNAGSTNYNESPSLTPRPFDRNRDGVVCSEGSGILLLESLDSALERGVEILAEVVGFASLSDPSNIANPNAESMERCMRQALADADLTADQVDYVNAHATATEQGDVAESTAIAAVFGSGVPVSSLKGHIGHTLAASGALELAATVEMIRQKQLIPTLNLENIDSACAGVRHVTKIEEADVQVILKNNFALGGVNSSIVLRSYLND